MRYVLLLVFALLIGCTQPAVQKPPTVDSREWLAGDHHIHSRFSVGWDQETDPPSPIVGGDAIYPIPMNALMGRYYGLDWMAATDHGGPNHSKVNLELAYPEMLVSRKVVPEVVQFYALELNSPGADHASLIVAHTHHEADDLYYLESHFDRAEVWPQDPGRDTAPLMLEALRYMQTMPAQPIVIAHHPSRSAESLDQYGLYEPAEIRDWNDTAPNIAIGMEGAPGHQALALAKDGSATRNGPRGGYGRLATIGGYDPMTARLGGLWDALLGEGRRWWITANSDSHVHYTEGGADFWPGEYSKTYVYADKNHDAIMEGFRAGRIFVTTGDLIDALHVTVSSGGRRADIGGELEMARGADALVTIRFRDPPGPNHRGEKPAVRRVDLIVGEVSGPASDRTADANPTTVVERRFSPSDWAVEDGFAEMSYLMKSVRSPMYVRVRGTNTDQAEPLPDPRGEDPWSDLWFYANPVFITPQ